MLPIQGYRGLSKFNDLQGLREKLDHTRTLSENVAITVHRNTDL